MTTDEAITEAMKSGCEILILPNDAMQMSIVRVTKRRLDPRHFHSAERPVAYGDTIMATVICELTEVAIKNFDFNDPIRGSGR